MAKPKVTNDLFSKAKKMLGHELPPKTVGSILGLSTATVYNIHHARSLNDYFATQHSHAARRRQVQEATFLPGHIFGTAESNMEEIELDYPDAIAEETPVVNETTVSELALLQSIERETIGMRACLASIANLLRAANQKNGVREMS